MYCSLGVLIVLHDSLLTWPCFKLRYQCTVGIGIGIGFLASEYGYVDKKYPGAGNIQVLKV